MKLCEAMKLLEEGKKIRKSSWHPDSYIYATPNGLVYDERGHIYNGVLSEFVHSYLLEEYIDPPKLVELPPKPSHHGYLSFSPKCACCTSHIEIINSQAEFINNLYKDKK